MAWMASLGIAAHRGPQGASREEAVEGVAAAERETGERGPASQPDRISCSTAHHTI